MPNANPPNPDAVFAFFGDVHGNLRALDAVLAEIANLASDIPSSNATTLRVQTKYALGDHLWGGSEPAQVWRQLVAAGVHCLRGLSDTALAQIDVAALATSDPVEQERLRDFEAVRRSLGDLTLERLRRLPLSVRLPLPNGLEVLALHGSPLSPFEELSFDLDDEEIEARLNDEVADVIVCAASHVPFQRQLPGKLVVNVGSVGQSPAGKIADYTLIRAFGPGVQVEQKQVAY